MQPLLPLPLPLPLPPPLLLPPPLPLLKRAPTGKEDQELQAEEQRLLRNSGGASSWVDDTEELLFKLRRFKFKERKTLSHQSSLPLPLLPPPSH